MRKIKPHTASIACYSVAIALLVLSLSHLSHGIQQATGSPYWHAITMAIGIDCALIALELSDLASQHLKAYQRVRSLCRAGIVATLALSAALNVQGFLAGASSLVDVTLAVILGCFVPVMIFALIRVGQFQQTSARVQKKVKRNNVRSIRAATPVARLSGRQGGQVSPAGGQQ